jgi:hypothetical protein
MASCCVMARMAALSRCPISWAISERRTVCGQSTITYDAALSPFSGFGKTSIRRMESGRNAVVMGNTVA